MIFAWLRAHIYIRWGWPPLNQNPSFLPYVIGYTDKWENSELNTIYQSLKRYFSIWMHQQQLFNMQIEDLLSWYLLRKHIFTTNDKGPQTYWTFYANNFDHNCGIFSNSGPTTDFSNIFVRDRDPFADLTMHRTNIF